MTESMYPSTTGVGLARDSITREAQGWRSSARRAERIRRRTSLFQSDPADRRVDLADDDVDHAVEQLVLVGHVLVERHRHDAQFLSELAHVQRLDPRRVGERHGGAQHAVPAERHPTRSAGRWTISSPSFPNCSLDEYLLTSVRGTPNLRPAGVRRTPTRLRLLAAAPSAHRRTSA